MTFVLRLLFFECKYQLTKNRLQNNSGVSIKQSFCEWKKNQTIPKNEDVVIRDVSFGQ